MAKLDDKRFQGVVRSLSGGMNNKEHPSLIARNEAESIVNWDLDAQALGSKRLGIDLVSALSGTEETWAIGEFEPPGSDPKLLTAIGPKVYSWEGGTGSFTEVATNTGADPCGEEMSRFVQVRDFTNTDYFSVLIQPTATCWAWNGTGSMITGTNVPNGNDATFFIERLWVGDDEGIVHASDFATPLTFNSLNSYKIGPGHSIKRLMLFMNAGLVVFFEDYIALLDVDQDYAFQGQLDGTMVHVLNSDIGTVSGHSVVQAGSEIFFLSRHGVHRMSKTEQDKTQALIVPASDKIQATIDRINFAVADRFVATVWDNKYLLAVALDSAATPDHVLVYDLRTDSWSLWDSWDIGGWVHSRVDGTQKLYFGTASGTSEVFEALTGRDDNGTDITSTIEAREEDFDAPSETKEFQSIEVYASRLEGGTVNVYTEVDGDAYALLGAMDLSSDIPQLDIQMEPETSGGTPGFRLAGSGSIRKKFSLRSLGHVRSIRFKFETTGSEELELLKYVLAGYVDEERLD